jgi:hypothetical protein
MATIESQLAHLQSYDNETQLSLLFNELKTLTVAPSHEWFQSRYRVIHDYSELNWYQLAKKFEHRDYYMCQTAQVIFALCAQLVDEWQTRPQFNLKTYAELIEEVYDIWNYYRDNYNMDEEEIDDLSELMMTQCTVEDDMTI